jgi:tetratricopeptide (TPR) repeat protein
MAARSGIGPDPGQANDLADFIGLLGELRIWMGRPPFRTLAKRVGPLMKPPQPVSLTTVADAFKVGRRRLDLGLVVAIVRALGLAEPEVARWHDACVRVHAHAKTGGTAGVFRQLPADLATFTGRDRELAELLRAAKDDGVQTVVVSAIEGMAGVGKTRLALHAAHALLREGRYADAQLYVNLRGFDPEQAPTDPAQVLDAFLRQLDVPAQQIPAGLEERAAMFRDRMHGRQALVVLDNAANEQQVRDLIPAEDSCLVLVTSRRSLAGLDGASLHRLDVFTQAEAVELLARIAGAERVQAEHATAIEIVEACGLLPLAVTLAASRLRSRPSWRLADLAKHLSIDGLDAVRDRGRSLRPVFDLSYQELPPQARRLFRLLGLHPGHDVTADSAAALTGLTVRQARTTLEQLLDESLLQQSVADRYELHDLLRAYALDRARAELSDHDRDDAVRQVLAWYLHSAGRASHTVRPNALPLRLDPAPACVHPVEFAGVEDALGWYEAERGNLNASVGAAADSALDAVCWQLTLSLSNFFAVRSYWTDWLDTATVALAAASRSQDQLGQAMTHTTLGRVSTDLHRFDDALDHYRQALTYYRHTGDAVGEARLLLNIGGLLGEQGDLAESAAQLRLALPRAQQAGEPTLITAAAVNLARTLVELDQLEEARELAERALAIRTETGDTYGMGTALAVIALVYRRQGRAQESLDYLERAAGLRAGLGDQRGAAELMTHMAEALDDCGQATEAETKRQEANRIFLAIKDPQAR